jgi:hypothetical protein
MLQLWQQARAEHALFQSITSALDGQADHADWTFWVTLTENAQL